MGVCTVFCQTMYSTVSVSLCCSEVGFEIMLHSSFVDLCAYVAPHMHSRVFVQSVCISTLFNTTTITTTITTTYVMELIGSCAGFLVQSGGRGYLHC